MLVLCPRSGVCDYLQVCHCNTLIHFVEMFVQHASQLLMLYLHPLAVLMPAIVHPEMHVTQGLQNTVQLHLCCRVDVSYVQDQLLSMERRC